jgi:transposase
MVYGIFKTIVQSAGSIENIAMCRRYPDALIRERADFFGVCPATIQYALRQMGITHKKTLRYIERDTEARIRYLHILR